jgi:hypothetical protein
LGKLTETRAEEAAGIPDRMKKFMAYHFDFIAVSVFLKKT